MQASTYTEFSTAMHTAVAANAIPSNGTIEVSHRCPLTCSHCYNNLPMGDRGARALELTTDQHRRIADEIAEMGCLWLLYTGGEIFARRDFMDIYKHAKRAGLLITLFTNGVLITPQIADELMEWRPFSIEITLYGRTRETYERLTGIPGSFDKCIRGIELLLERRLPLKLKAVAVSVNRHEVLAMRKFARDLGVEFKFDPMINPRIDCSSSPLAVRLSPADILALDFEDPVRTQELQRLGRHFPAMKPAEGEKPKLYQCGAGLNSFAIDPYGQLTMCILSHQEKFDLRNGSFRDGWSYLRTIRERPASLPTKCSSCDLRSMCGMCPAEGELENGDPEKPVDFLCATAHLRALALDIPVRPHGECEFCEGGEMHHTLAPMLHHAREQVAHLSEEITMMADLPQVASSGCGTGCSSCSIR